MAGDEYPISKQLESVKCGEYGLTYASWDTGYGPSYELGIRNMTTGEFTLVQSERFQMFNGILVIRAVSAMLTYGMSPNEIKEVL